MKLAHLTSAHPRYDTRIYYKMCSSLAKKDYEVYLIVADGKGNEIIQGIKIYDVGKASGRIKRILFTTFKVFIKAQKLNANLYHFHDPELITIGLKLKRKGKKVIYDIHEDLVKQILLKNWIPKSLRKAISLIT